MNARSTRWVLWSVGVAAALTMTVLVINATDSRRRQAQQPTSGNVGQNPFDNPLALPPFTLTDQSGKPFGSKQLKGKVWVASFVFTRCAGTCPLIFAQTAQLQSFLPKELGDDVWQHVRLVSISVDPDYDTPAVLTERGKLWKANFEHWRLLTGTRDDIRKLIRDGFIQPVDDKPANRDMPIYHSQQYVLVDQTGGIRGFYDALDQAERQKLVADMKRLLE